MAKVILKNGIIQALSGKFGNIVYRTLKSGKIVATMPRPCSVPATKQQIQQREQFATIAAQVAQRKAAGDPRPKKAIWAEIKSGLSRD